MSVKGTMDVSECNNVQVRMIKSSRIALGARIARTCVLRVVYLDLGMKPHHFQMIQTLSDADKIAQVQTAVVILEMTIIDPNVLFFKSYEVIFHDSEISKFVVLGPYLVNDQIRIGISYLDMFQYSHHDAIWLLSAR